MRARANRKRKGEKELRKISLAIFVVVFSSIAMLPQLRAQLKPGAFISQDDILDKYESWPVSGKLTLDWVVYPWHTVRFWDCKGFIIDQDDTELDLNGHTVMFKSGIAGPGLTGIELIGKRGVTVKNGSIIDFQYGIWIQDSSDVKTESFNIIGSGKNGIWSRESENIDIGFNHVTASGDVAIGTDNCFDVSIHDNTVVDNEREGIYLKESDNNTVSGNLATENGYYGIYAVDSDNNTISGNTISDDTNGGIYMGGADNNTISGNTISNNPTGMKMEDSFGNIIYHNNFINNMRDVDNYPSFNTWDAGYGLAEDVGFGGNYWDEFETVDEFSGKNQDILGSDGISDTLYMIDESNQDRYPLTNPWGTMFVDYDITWKFFNPQVGWEDRTCRAVAFSNSSVTDFEFNMLEGELSFTAVSGTFCTLIVPNEALGGAFAVTIDDVPSASILTWDENHHFIRFDLANGDHEVKVRAETVLRIAADLDGNGEVNIIDIAMAAKEFGNKIG